MKTKLLVWLCLMPCLRLSAQEAEPAFMPQGVQVRSTMLGIGHLNALDTYLSPVDYRGTALRFLRENSRMTRRFHGRLSVQHVLSGYAAYASPRSEEGDELLAMWQWNATWHYHLPLNRRLLLMAGAGTELQTGFAYTFAGSNNPAQARLSGRLAGSVAAIYSVDLFRRKSFVRWQVDAPLLGLMFSPEYGESYYELFSLGHHGHHACLTWPFSAPTLVSHISLEWPLRANTFLRVGYLMDIDQRQPNHLKQHEWSHTVLLGYTKRLRILP